MQGGISHSTPRSWGCRLTVESSTPTLADVFAGVLRSYSDGLRVMIPAEVVSWSSSTPGRVAVQPTVRLLRRVEGARLAYRPPVLPQAPVAWPGGGDYAITWPLEVGSTGMLIFADRSIDEWAVTAQADSTPRDMRRHAYADGVFVPGLRSLEELPARSVPGDDHLVISCPAAGEVRLGSASASDFIALASLVEARLDELKTAITNGVAVPNDGGASLQTTILAGLTSWPGNVASARVRSE